MNLVDFHTHILPGIDDGSSSVEMSRSMLEEEKRQGVGTVILTPHFYVSEQTAEKFLERRRAALKEILPIGHEMGLKLVAGAEVYYFEGIRNFPDLESLCIGRSQILLLEMPFSNWSDRLVGEVKGIAGTRNVRVVLAHIDRYVSYYKPEQLESLLAAGVQLQMNAGCICDVFSRRRALRMIGDGLIAHVGSDTHNMDSRRPNMGKAASILAKTMDPAAVMK